MTEEQEQSKINEISQILKENGIEIDFSADHCFCEIYFQGELIINIQGSDTIVKLGDDEGLVIG